MTILRKALRGRRSSLWLISLAVLAAAVGTFLLLGSAGGNGSSPVETTHYGQKRFPVTGFPLVGAYYTHYDIPGCRFNGSGTGILNTYHDPGVRAKVHRQLYRMRKRGATTLRILLWHMTDPKRANWGVVSSRGGKLDEQVETNLIGLIREIKRYGFARLSIGFGPQATNNPKRENYDESKFEENWSLIQLVRPLLKRYGPRDIQIDLLNEGGISNFMPKPLIEQRKAYIRRIYRNYVRAFGRSDVTVSSHGPKTPIDRAGYLQNMIDLFRSTGQGQPGRYELHLRIGWGRAQTLIALRNYESVLRRNGLRQKVVIGQANYNDPVAAEAIADFNRDTRKRVEEVLEWPARDAGSCYPDPPLRVDEYRNRLVADSRGDRGGSRR